MAAMASTTAAATASSTDVVDHLTKKRDCVFIVNPRGANGRTGKQWKSIYPVLSLELGKHYNVSQVLTSGPSHATELTRKAVKDGAAAVIAVGGDGTLHEVVNGFFDENRASGARPKTSLALLPLGTGSDFARTLEWKNDPYEATKSLARAEHKNIDIGYARVGEEASVRYFINVADVHLSARAGYLAGKYKWLGNMSYVLGALHGFIYHNNCDLDIKINGGEWTRFPAVTSIAIGNAKYYGGGMKITPTADPCSGELEVTILQHFKWYHFLLHLSKLYNGTHVKLDNVWHQSVWSIEIKKSQEGSIGDVYVQADGEHLGFLPATFGIMPAALEFIC